MAQGLIRRAAGLVAAMLIVLGVSATDASAQSGVTIVTPTIQGSGATTAAGYSCSLSIAPNTDPTNSSTSTCAAPNVTPSIPSCAFVTRDGCIWNYTANAALTAVPAAGWQFVTWVNCSATSSTSSSASSPTQNSPNPTIQGFPRATFREIVAIAGDGVPEDFAFSPDFTSAKRPRVSFATQVPGSVYRCEVRNAANAVVQAKNLCTSPFAPSTDLPDGKYTYNVWAYHRPTTSRSRRSPRPSRSFRSEDRLPPGVPATGGPLHTGQWDARAGGSAQLADESGAPATVSFQPQRC